MKLITWNVNGIRACAKKGFLDFLAAESPDLLALQETKAHKEQVTPEVVEPPGYRTFFSSAHRRGYSGVALYVREDLAVEVEPGLGIEEFDQEGRTQIAHVGDFSFLNSYYPNSQRTHARLPYKLAYDKAIREKAQELRGQGRGVILTGDFNAAHTEIDLANPKQNTKNAGFLPEERAWVTEMLELGYVDIFRERHPGEEGHYTWWTYRANARERNIGWRLDYFLITPDLVERVQDTKILADVHGSDHCPVRLELASK